MRVWLAALGAITALHSPAFAQDADSDGVPDDADTYPCDSQLAATRFMPAEDAYGLLLFEDQWPTIGDGDFNDLVLAYNYLYRLDAQGRVASMKATLHVTALGALYNNGLGLHIQAPASAVSQIQLQIGSAPAVALIPDSRDSELTVRLVDNLRDLFGGVAGQLNARSDQARVPSASMVVQVDFATPVDLPSSAGPHDPFLYRSADFSHQVHLPRFGGTAAMNVRLFSSMDDNSTGARNFVDTRGLPFVLDLPQSVAYPKEGQPLELLYPDVVTFAASGGTAAQDFYASTVIGAFGYQDSRGLGPIVPTAPVAEPVADRACLPTTPGTDGGSSAHLDRVLATTHWSLNSGTAYTEYVLRAEGWQISGDHYDDTYEVRFTDETGADLTTGQHGSTVQCTFVTDGSCWGPCASVPGHLFDGANSWYGPHYSYWWELSCTFDRPVIVRTITNTAYSAAYGQGPRTLFARRGDGKLINIPVDAQQPCQGCTATDISLPWGASNTQYLTSQAQP